MIIKEITLNNFGSYYEKNTLKFSYGEKNVNLIYAAGGSGKTTLLNAIKWCLYGFNGENETNTALTSKEKKKLKEIDLLNHKYSNEKGNTSKSFSVELIFFKDDIEYKVKRVMNFIENNPGLDDLKLWKNKNDISDPQGVIDNIVPRNLNFFFEGEGVEDLIKSGKNVKESIFNVLGLKPIKNSIEDLDYVLKAFKGEYAQANSDNKEYLRYIQEEKEIEEKLEKLNKEKGELHSEKAYLEEIIEKNQNEINKLFEESVKDNVEQKDKLTELQSDLMSYRNNLKSTENDYNKTLSKEAYKVFSEKILEIAFKEIEKKYNKNEVPTQYEKEFIEGLLESNECICGTKLVEGDASYNKLKELLKVSVEKKVRTNFTEIYFLLRDETKDQNSNVIRNKIETFQSEIIRLNEEIRNREEKEEKLLESTKNDHLIKKYNNLVELNEKKNKELDKIQIDILNNRNEITGKGKELESIRKYIVESEKKNKKNKILRNKKELAENLFEILKRHLIFKEEEAHANLNEAIFRVYSFVNRNNWTPKLNGNFEFELYNQDGVIQTQLSGSERKNKALAFVGGLIMCAKELRKNKSIDAGIEGGVYPLVLDGPFGELDDRYRIEIAEIIPELSDQVIIMVNSGQWSTAQEKALKNKIGKKYILKNLIEENKKDSVTFIEEV